MKFQWMKWNRNLEKKDKRRRTILAVWMLIIIMIMILQPIELSKSAADLYTYYTTHFHETGADNAVTAIYLDYRMYDTLFETLLLMISVIGIIHFSVHETEEEN